jgi:ubiquinone/menaquinone biosynthesis C-methylase UbiE
MKFEGDVSLLQQKMAGSSAGVARRLAVMNALNLQAGDTVLDIGCGAGHLVQEIGLAVGSRGKAFGLDPSETQIDAARRHCDALSNTQFLCCLADQIDLPDASCDAIASIQTLDYIEDVDTTLDEVVRLLKPRSSFVNVSVLWDHFKFHGADETINNIIHDAWRAHCYHQMLPLELSGKLAKLGIGNIRTESLAFVITQRHENSPAIYAEMTLANYAISQGVDEDKVQAWRSQLAQAEAEGRFGFTSFPVLTVGSKR